MENAIKNYKYTKRAEIYKRFRAECKKPGNQKCKYCGFINGKLKKMLKLPTTISY